MSFDASYTIVDSYKHGNIPEDSGERCYLKHSNAFSEGVMAMSFGSEERAWVTPHLSDAEVMFKCVNEKSDQFCVITEFY